MTGVCANGHNGMHAGNIILSGYMGAGKSVCARLLTARGYRMIDADTEAKRVMAADPQVREQLAMVFGPGVTTGGTINFKELGACAFASLENLTALNRIVHPPVIAELYAQLDAPNTGPIVLDAALGPLWPSLPCRFTASLWIHASQQVRMDRIIARTGLPADIISRRMNLQEQMMPQPPQPPWTYLPNHSSVEALTTALSAMVETGDSE